MFITQGIIFPLLWILTFLFSTEKNEVIHEPEAKDRTDLLLEELSEKYEQLPTLPAMDLALEGYEKLEKELKNPVLTVIDFSLPSTKKRLWVIDLKKKEVLMNTVVSHGRNSGLLMAKKFSNNPQSYQSSLGFYKTGETYLGKHGYSLRLDGLENGFNDQARNRAIVVHGADYAREEVAKMSGRLGRSLGCPAVPSELSKEVIDLIKNGSLLFIFGQDENYLREVPLLKPA
jgi:hypothetical protein